MTEELLFQAISKSKNRLPWFDRSFLTDMVCFGPDEDGFVVLVTSEAMATLCEGTRQQAPSEAFGQLMGRAYADGTGSFTVVTGAVYAHRLKSSNAHVQLTSEEMGELRRQARRAYPAADFVGWTHSHHSFSGYSQIDREEQKTWIENHNIGILTFMQGNPWAVVYRGPSARPLPLMDTTPLLRRKVQNPSSFRLSPQTQNGLREQTTQTTAVQPQVFSDHSWYLRVIVIVGMIWLLVVTLLLGAFLFSIDRDIRALRSQIDRPVLTSLLWSCDRQEGQAPLQVACTGPVGPAITGWIWDFGDGTDTEVNASTITHMYQEPGVYKVTLRIVSSFSNQGAGSLKITILSPTNHTGRTERVK